MRAHSLQKGARHPPTGVADEGQGSYLRKFCLLAGGDLAVEEGRLLNLTLFGDREGDCEERFAPWDWLEDPAVDLGERGGVLDLC